MLYLNQFYVYVIRKQDQFQYLEFISISEVNQKINKQRLKMQEEENLNSTHVPIINNKPPQQLIDEAFAFSEFINTIKITTSETDFKLLKPLTILPPTSQQAKSITPFHFRQLAIQFFYLLYSCWHLKIVPVPEDDQKFICYSYQNNNVCLCLNQFVYFADSVIKDYETTIPYFMYYKNFISAIHMYWKSAQQQSQKQSKREHLSADYFLNKLSQLQQTLSNSNRSMNIENSQLLTQKQAFQQFEKQQIFIETSILLRINRSALVCVIKRNDQLVQLYNKHRKIQQELSDEYNERRKRKNNVEKVLETEKNIQKNIQEFFVNLKGNPEYYKVEDKRRKEGGGGLAYGSNKLIIGLKVYQQSYSTITQMGNSNQNKTAYDPDYYNNYEIEYQSMKNMIIVRMVTDLILDWATSDSILFKWNTLTFQTSNVGLETIQKTDQQNKVRKFIVIRGTSYFNKKQPVIEKMLTLIDITMATYKSIELEMKSENFFNKNINKINESYMKINHYLKAMHKCCQRTYDGMLTSDVQQ